MKNNHEVQTQIKNLDQRIELITNHLKGNHKDKHSLKSLLSLVSSRKKLTKYLNN